MGKLASGKTVLITGASRGVGECLACCLAREGAKLILISEEKTKDELKQVGGWGGREVRGTGEGRAMAAAVQGSGGRSEGGRSEGRTAELCPRGGRAGRQGGPPLLGILRPSCSPSQYDEQAWHATP